MSRKEQPIKIIVAGPAASGKTAIVGLIAQMLKEMMEYPDIQIIDAEFPVETMKEKVSAFINGKMTHVLEHPIEIMEASTPIKGAFSQLLIHRRLPTESQQVGTSADSSNTSQ